MAPGSFFAQTVSVFVYYFQPFMINIIPNLIEHQTTGSAEDHIFNYKMRSNEFVITMQLSIWNLIETDFFSFFSFR